jgi:hypothetical protein
MKADEVGIGIQVESDKGFLYIFQFPTNVEWFLGVIGGKSHILERPRQRERERERETERQRERERERERDRESCSSLVVDVLSLSIREIVSSRPARASRVKPKTSKIGSDCSFAKSTAFKRENHGSLGYDLKNGGPVSQ